VDGDGDGAADLGVGEAANADEFDDAVAADGVVPSADDTMGAPSPPLAAVKCMRRS